MRLLLIFCTFFLSYSSTAQRIDNSFAYNQLHSDRYIRINYENDFFANTDEYYSQGASIELASPFFKQSFLRHLFPAFNNNEHVIGIGIEQDAFTPTNILSNSILYHDRPFAATLSIKPFSVSTDGHKQRLAGTLCLGVIGPAAGGKEVQTFIHAHTNNARPQGWQYQISNDIIANYRLMYEHSLLHISNCLLLTANGEINAGTLSNKLGVGSTVMAGLFNSPFTINVNNSVLNAYWYNKAFVNIIGYDATLHGGIVNSTSAYTIPATDVQSLTFTNCMGICLAYRSFTLLGSYTYLSKELNTGTSHSWGGLQLAYTF